MGGEWDMSYVCMSFGLLDGFLGKVMYVCVCVCVCVYVWQTGEGAGLRGWDVDVEWPD